MATKKAAKKTAKPAAKKAAARKVAPNSGSGGFEVGKPSVSKSK